VNERVRRTIVLFLSAFIAFIFGVYEYQREPDVAFEGSQSANVQSTDFAKDALYKLEVKGRAPKTGYSRSLFGQSWADIGGCDTRNLILQRDLTLANIADGGCRVLSGELLDPYTGKNIHFMRGEQTSDLVQIDHVVSLSDAWQKGAQNIDEITREKFANDPLNLLAVDGPINIQKGDGDSATWLPPNKPYRCQFIARQIAVKLKYNLWITKAERDAMGRILTTCPDQRLPQESTS
jgi:hypothetical protein